ncbi:two-component sensor histidine kinase, partial [Ralstonia pseudosolanacearum]
MRHGTERLMAGAAPEGTASPSAVHHPPMSEPDFPFSSASPRRGFGWLVAAALVAVMALVCATTFVVTWNRGLSQAQQAAGAR